MRRLLGFTLVELLVVIAIIGILMSMTVPAVSYVREIAHKTACSANIYNLLMAMQSYESLMKTYPPGRVGCDCGDSTSYRKCRTTGANTIKGYQRSGTSGFVMMLPQLDNKPLYDMFNRFRNGAVFPGGEEKHPKSTTCGDSDTNGWRKGITGGNETLLIRPAVFVCPSSRDETSYDDVATGCYAMCMGSLGPSYKDTDTVKYNNNGMFMYHRTLSSRDAVDGLSNTIYVGEVSGSDSEEGRNWWMVGSMYLDSLRTTEYMEWHKGYVASVDEEREPMKEKKLYGQFSSPHRNGVNFGFGDGRVDFLTDDIDITLLQNLSTRDAAAFAAFNSNRDYREVHTRPN